MYYLIISFVLLRSTFHAAKPRLIYYLTIYNVQLMDYLVIYAVAQGRVFQLIVNN